MPSIERHSGVEKLQAWRVLAGWVALAWDADVRNPGRLIGWTARVGKTVATAFFLSF